MFEVKRYTRCPVISEDKEAKLYSRYSVIDDVVYGLSTGTSGL